MIRKGWNVFMMAGIVVSENKAVFRIHILKSVFVKYDFLAFSQDVNGKFERGHIYEY